MKKRGGKALRTCAQVLGGSGGMLPWKILNFKLLLVHSWGLCVEWRIFNLEAIHCRLSYMYLQGRGGDLIKGERVPNVVRTLATQARNPELNLRYL